MSVVHIVEKELSDGSIAHDVRIFDPYEEQTVDLPARSRASAERLADLLVAEFDCIGGRVMRQRWPA